MQEYIALDSISKEILNSAKLLQSVEVNALILGENGVGKKSLAKYILPNSKIYEAKALQKDIIDNILTLQNESIIIDRVNEITNIDIFINWIEKNQIRVIATSQASNLNQKLKDLFIITLEIPPLKNRIEDTKALINKFSLEASSILEMPLVSSSKLITNISNNTHSLRKSIYFSYLFETIGENEILTFLEKYLSENLSKNSSYKDLLYLFEVPLLKAAIKKYKSQVQVAKHLDLNRITLRKKLEVYKELL
ncbi:helix-turn-helix domain-containing protein [Aliarcobacter butzleri]|uniref:Helix-turn-helix domain-containing protein n=1 Tax=Aliarcobacter butzleri TaxID=28197 RepID=A0AAP4PXQ3_9BACT|nr:helix-turn-helix domain-containing protein [Aliarcobacter butzleri]MCT7556342.1 Fis family transcriptional regulator [Aliarcobacter butzleri]MCT7613223.1 Fis family transcriptional regulator [Aliarcobacter butzleri]MCT7640769.1 Fis family transcriptional regulator [Aliarcobacter butzleri]MDN5052280.1 Fis family transcriptional regulator [Aliarcobacter butzleri]MDN5075299.1 Fis family transcriptional regulator [Aliarcobacter butzleri]